ELADLSSRSVCLPSIQVDEIGLPSRERRVVIAVRVDNRNGHARNCIGDIVVCTGPVIDAVPATATGAPFERAQLTYQLRVIHQIDSLRINQRHHISVQFALWFGRRFVPDAELCKTFSRPTRGVSITYDL